MQQNKDEMIRCLKIQLQNFNEDHQNTVPKKVYEDAVMSLNDLERKNKAIERQNDDVVCDIKRLEKLHEDRVKRMVKR